MKSTFFLLLGTMVSTIAILTACQSNFDSGQPEPSPTVVSVPTKEVIETSTSVPPSATVEVTQSLPDPMQEGEQIPYILLYKIIVAGDYYVLRISGDGQAEFTNYSRTYTIATHKLGNLSPEQTKSLFALLNNKNFFTLEDEYHLPTPQAGAPEEEFEDTYYWVEVFDGQRKKKILSHEYASPPELETVTQALLNAVAQMSESHTEGNYLLAIDHQILPYLRREENMPHLQFNKQSVTEYPFLEQALRTPGSIIQIENLTESKEKLLFPSEAHMMEVIFNEEKFLVLLLAI